MDFSFSDLNLQLDGQLPINFNSVVIDNVAMLPSIENLPGFEALAAFLMAKRFAVIPTIPRQCSEKTWILCRPL